MKGKAIFIAGTDTEVGKTLVTGLLAHYLSNRGLEVVTQKWIQTGCSNSSSDIKMHLEIMGRKISEYRKIFQMISPYILKFPASPHLSVRFQKVRISKKRIKSSLFKLCSLFELVLVEGTGGLLVPFNSKELILDVVEELNLPILLVVGNRLGAINHSLLSIESIRGRNLKLIGLIFNNLSFKTNRLILRDNSFIAEKISRVRVLGTLPRFEGKNYPYQEFASIGAKVYNWLKRNG
ncbi:MAG TPA: dethiobiotin synthase [Archaeoglobaceae archaeon]|nr:dethiobiotin synthase [Archaeoglobaceae archaeon]